jgi:UDP-glucose 4-epimerase
VLDDLSGGFKDNVHPEALFIQGTITNQALVEQIFDTHKFDYVYHLAAYAAEGLSHFIRKFNYENNLIGSINLINASVTHKVKCFVFTSSIAVYGAAKPPMTEQTHPFPEDPYGIAKLAVEYDLKCAHEMFGLDYVIFRPHNVYGEYQNIGDKYRNVVGIFMNQILQGKPLTVFGDGLQTRAFSYIGDVAPYIAQAPFQPEAINQVFNIGADKEYTILELAEAVTKAMGDAMPVRHLEARNEVVHAYCDHSLAKSVFQIEKTISLHEGLARMANYVKEKGSRISTKFENIEIEENLPLLWRE